MNHLACLHETTVIISGLSSTSVGLQTWCWSKYGSPGLGGFPRHLVMRARSSTDMSMSQSSTPGPFSLCSTWTKPQSTRPLLCLPCIDRSCLNGSKRRSGLLIEKHSIHVANVQKHLRVGPWHERMSVSYIKAVWSNKKHVFFGLL